MKEKISFGRLTYEPTFGYRDGVLIGPNWYEEKQHYIKEKHKHGTTYDHFFKEKEPSFVHPNVYWNNRIKGEGIEYASLMCHDKKNYYDNFTTTSDLVYKWLPKCKPKKKEYDTIYLTFVPEQDLALGRGNLTSFGLKEAKKLTWNFQKLTEPSSWTTENKDNYMAPKPEEYPRRFATPKIISSKLYNKDESHLTSAPEFPLDVKERPFPNFG